MVFRVASRRLQQFLNSQLEQLDVILTGNEWTQAAKEVFFHHFCGLRNLRYLVRNGESQIPEFHRDLRYEPSSQFLVSLTLNLASFASKALCSTVKALKYNVGLKEMKLSLSKMARSDEADLEYFKSALLADVFLEAEVGKLVLINFYRRFNLLLAALLQRQASRNQMKPLKHIRCRYSDSRTFCWVLFSVMEKVSRTYGKCSLAGSSTYPQGTSFRKHLRSHHGNYVGGANYYHTINYIDMIAKPLIYS